MKKKMLIVMLIFSLVPALLLPASFAATEATTGICGDNLTWNLASDGTLTISGTGPMYDYESSIWNGDTRVTNLVINKGVTTIGNNAFNFCRSLVSVDIADTVTTVGDFAFTSCYELTSVEFKHNLTYIGRRVFYRCSKLTTISLPDTLSSTHNEAFQNCVALTSINVDANNNNFCSIDGVFFAKEGNNGKRLILYPCNKAGASYTFPSGTTAIEASAFSKNKLLESVIIPDSVLTVGKDCFNSSEKLASVVIGDGVTNIEENTFGNCYNLSGLSIGKSVNKIAGNAISGCSSLKNISISEDNKSYASNDGILMKKDGTLIIKCFNDDNKTNYTIPSGVTEIGDSAFENLKNIREITIPDGVVKIGNSAFSGIRNLTKITIPDTVTTIGNEALAWNENITEIVIPDSVTTLGDSMFKNCIKLINVKLSKNITKIPIATFMWCEALPTIDIPGNVTIIEGQAFDSCYMLKSVNLHPGLKEIHERAFAWCRNLSLICIPKTVEMISDNDVFIDTGLSKLYIENGSSVGVEYAQKNHMDYATVSLIYDLALVERLNDKTILSYTEPVGYTGEKEIYSFVNTSWEKVAGVFETGRVTINNPAYNKFKIVLTYDSKPFESNILDISSNQCELLNLNNLSSRVKNSVTQTTINPVISKYAAYEIYNSNEEKITNVNIPLTVGTNNFTVKVIAENNEFKVYPIEIYRQSISEKPVLPGNEKPILPGTKITISAKGEIIKYTLDGTDPDENNGILYTSPITITDDTTLKVVAKESDKDEYSEVVTKIYEVVKDEKITLNENTVKIENLKGNSVLVLTVSDNGVLKECIIKNINTDQEIPLTETGMIINKGNTIKAFLFDSLLNIRPLCDAKGIIK